MDLILKNCNNIENGSVKIEEGRLNIKYAINGTGKSTVSKAISCYVEDKKNSTESLNQLKPFRHIETDENNPKIEGVDSIQTVKVFDEKYMDDFVFLPDELLKGSFNIFIKGVEYDQGLENIDNLVKILGKTFSDNNDLEELIDDFSELSDNFGRPTNKGIHGASKLSKAFKAGNKVENIPKGLEDYKEYIEHEDNFKWIKWQIDGKPYMDISENCPYCTSGIEEKKEKITLVAKEYNPKVIQNLNKIILVFQKLNIYFSDSTKESIEEFIKNVGGYTKEQEGFLTEVRLQIDRLKEKFLSIKKLGFLSLKDVDVVIDKLQSHIIDLDLYLHLKSEETQKKAELVNNSLESLIQKARELQGRITRQNIIVQKLVSKNKEKIDIFLNNAGYKYHVDLLENDQGEYQLKLIHNDLEGAISNVKYHLSYGERNAFSLILFMYDVLNSSPDLIILDDPISSFDKNKKYAIIDMLFRKSENFKGRTVLFLTHDFEPIVDMVHHHTDKFDKPFATFLENINGDLNEKIIVKENIKTFVEIIHENIRETINEINKLVYLRRLYEVTSDKGLGYQVLSNVFHKRSVPIIVGESGLRDMTLGEVQEGSENIKSYIENFEYTSIIATVNNNADMKGLYNVTTNNYEKLHIYRIIFDSNEEVKCTDVVKKFINEAFHIENDYIYQLNPRQYQLVPQYIIDECDMAIAEIQI